MKMSEVKPGQEFYHVAHNLVGVRMYIPDHDEKLCIAYAPTNGNYIRYSLPDDEVRV